MIRQVFVTEKLDVEGQIRVRPQLAFGDHPDFDADDDRVVTSAVAGTNQEIRVVFDELLKGNMLEEIACADGMFSGDYANQETFPSGIPDDTTPDDIADCAGPPDSLTDCTKVCIGPNGPIGVLDENEDGASDDFRMVEYEAEQLGAILECDGTNIPLSPELSFWNPSGNQQIPAGPLEHRGLGPVLVLVPEQGMRTGANCTIRFRPEVTDKDGEQICAPEDGDITKPCTPGDTDLVDFAVEPLALGLTDPRDGKEDVSLDTQILLQFNAAVDMASMSNVTLEDDGGTPLTLTPMVQMDDQALVIIDIEGGLAPETSYELTVPTTVTDIFGGALPQERVIMFSTETIEPTPDASVPDAGLPDAA